MTSLVHILEYKSRVLTSKQEVSIPWFQMIIGRKHSRETSDSPVCEAIQLKISEGEQHESDEQAWVVHSFQR
jgi:hypothetical protein